MGKSTFKKSEVATKGTTLELHHVLDELTFNEDGLIPVVAQQFDSLEVLMLAWMNREAIEKTLASGMMTYWSRSRQEYWTKGLTSGHLQHFKEMRIDCDGDALLCFVDQIGAACHTDRRNCFFYSIEAKSDHVVITSDSPKAQ
jgi:phosphoribosyl-AMP cyclohydrolase